jgi:2-polyprenyl-3-methyl-5-hydroxy-6-metoxy-1,4-benzoquinol methylase
MIMNNTGTSKGILDERYASERQKKPELIFRYKTRARLVYNCAKKFIGRTSGIHLLDFGAAEGLTLLELNNLLHESRLTGIEYSKELLSKAPPTPENVVLKEGDVTDLPAEIPNESYDIVCALALLEHLPEPRKAINEAKNKLKSGGIFVATSPSPFWDAISTKLGLLREEQHETEMNKKLMKGMIKDAGMEVVTFDRFMFTPVAFLPYLKVNVSPSFSLKVDKVVSALKIFNWLFVNQVVIGRKK